MTTILGIRAIEDNEVIMASDLQGFSLDAGLKKPIRKMYKTEDDSAIIGISGV